MSDIEHGTYGGYQKHKKLGEQPCLECVKANRFYIKDYRARNPESIRKDKLRAKARQRALNELASRHKREFQKILQEMS